MENCTSAGAEDECAECDDGYYLDNDQCYETTDRNCNLWDSNAGSEICLTCNDGY